MRTLSGLEKNMFYLIDISFLF